MPDEQKIYNGDQENDQKIERETNPQSPESTEIAKLQAELLETHQAAAAIIQDLNEFKQYLTPNLDEAASQISLESALDFVSSVEQQQNAEKEEIDWEALNQAQSKLIVESNSLSDEVLEIRDQVSTIDSDLRNLAWDQQDRRDKLFGEPSIGEIEIFKKKIRGLFLGIKEYSESFSKRDLETKKEELEERREEIRAQSKRIREASQKINQFVTEQASLHLETEAPKLVEVWEKHAEDMAQAAWVDGEITQTFITDKILPALERQEQAGKFTAEEKNKFLDDLSNFIQARNVGDVERQNELQTELRNQHEIYTHVSYELQLLSEKEDQKIVKQMVAHLAHEQLSQFKEAFIKDLPANIASELNKVLEEKLKMDWRWRDGWEPKPALDSDKINVKVKNFDLLKRSETAKKIYGPLIKKLDERIYQLSMNESLIDVEGDYIDNLVYYPTPDAIKTLVILAAADRKGFRTSHANTSLTTLARREDWAVILDHAIESYPELAEVKDLLLSWDSTYQHNNPDIQQGAQSLAMRVLHSEAEDERLKAMAQESLKNNAMVVEMANKGAISQEDASSYQRAYDLLFELSHDKSTDDESVEAEQVDTYKHNLEYWAYRARQILKGLDKVDADDPRHESLLADFKALLNLGEMWQEVEEDKEKLSFLSSSFAVDLAVGSHDNPQAASRDEMSFLKEAYDSYPLFKDDIKIWISRLIKNDPAYFLNESGMNSLQQFYDQYVELDPFVADKVSYLVSEKEIILKRALVLPQEAPDLLKENVALDNPELFLISDVASNYGRELLLNCRENGIQPRAIVQLVSLITDKTISRDRALVLLEIAPDLLNEWAALINPELFLANDEAISFGRKFILAYRENGVKTEIINEVARQMNNKEITQEMSLDFIKILPNIFVEDEEKLRLFIFRNIDSIAANPEDLKFLSRFIGTHGKQTLTVLKDYTRCVESGVVNFENRDKILEFTTQFRALSPTIVEGYLEAEANGVEDVYIADLQQMSEQMVSSEPMSDSDREKPYYLDLLRAVYGNNSGNWGGHEKTEACEDRVEHLAEFSFEPKYEIDLLSASEVKVKEGEEINEAEIKSLKTNILNIAEEMNELNFDLEKIQADFNAQVDELIAERQAEGDLENIDLNQLNNIDEKIFILLTDSVYGDEQVPSDDLKELILRYEFAFFDDVRDYIQGTTDRVSEAPNQDYAEMCELHSFFADRIKEINRRLVRKGWDNPMLRELMPEYFAKVSQERAQTKTEDQLNRLRVDRLGMSESFFEQISRTVERRMGKKYPPETIEKLINYYENITEGLTVKSTSDKGLTKAFYGQLRAQRDKTMEAIETLTGDKIDPQEFHLGETNLEDLAISLAELKTGQYDEEQFQAFTGLRFLNLFADERNLLEAELDKFESESGQERQVLNGYFTKTKESANARMVGGVCVSRDNPVASRSPENQRPNMWDDEHYFQFVLQDPETSRCQGLVLLHHFEEKGERVLTASFNPSSTFLYSTDEKSMFNGLLDKLKDFALANDFDKILISQNKSIRTNRTGGEFESAMMDRVSQVDKTFSFEEVKDFSYSPEYKIKDTDVIWER